MSVGVQLYALRVSAMSVPGITRHMTVVVLKSFVLEVINIKTFASNTAQNSKERKGVPDVLTIEEIIHM